MLADFVNRVHDRLSPFDDVSHHVVYRRPASRWSHPPAAKDCHRPDGFAKPTVSGESRRLSDPHGFRAMRLSTGCTDAFVAFDVVQPGVRR